MTESVHTSRPLHLLEVGCGVGNAVIPLIEIHPTLIVHAIDLAPSAINILRFAYHLISIS